MAFAPRCSILLALATLLGTAMGGGYKNPFTPAEEHRNDEENLNYSKWCMISLTGTVAIVLLFKLYNGIHSKLRLLLSMGNDKQQYWASPSSNIFVNTKTQLLWAPLFRKRHNREFRLSTAVNVGTLPTRFQALFLFSYLAMNIVFCTFAIDWTMSKQKILIEFRNRTGIMAVINMVPLFLLASRNNPLIPMLRISFDSYNLLHRWFGRIVVLEAIAHTTAQLFKSGWSGFVRSLPTSILIKSGAIATIAFVVILLHSPSIFRHAFYETFLLLHVLLVATAVGALWYHVMQTNTIWIFYLKAAIGVWAGDRTFRLLRLGYRNIARKMTKATFEALPGDAVRVTLTMPRPWKFLPGQHAYIYVPTLGLWTSHPFTIAWSETKEVIKFNDEKLSLHRQDMLTSAKPTMSMVIRRRTGFTDTLYRKAKKSPDNMFTTTAFLEGPYGVTHSLDSYGVAILIAGGIGITHHVPYVRHLIKGHADGTVATRRILLVWIIQSPEHLEWIRPWMTEILAMEKRREILRIMLFVTKPKSTKEIHSPSSTVQMFPGKPNIATLLDMEIEQKMGTMGVSVCGTGSLSDDVRAVVRSRVHRANIDFIEESFSW